MNWSIEHAFAGSTISELVVLAAPLLDLSETIGSKPHLDETVLFGTAAHVHTSMSVTNHVCKQLTIASLLSVQWAQGARCHFLVMFAADMSDMREHASVIGSRRHSFAPSSPRFLLL
jgi:hypothetical protein